MITEALEESEQRILRVNVVFAGPNRAKKPTGYLVIQSVNAVEEVVL